MTGYHIRYARLHDAEALTELAREAFCDTFTHYEPDALASFLNEHYRLDGFRGELSDAANRFWVVENESGALIGYAKLGPYKLPMTPADGQVLELHRLYVLKAWQGHGLGAALMTRILSEAGSKAVDWLYLGVWSGNLNAQGFYGRYGFEKIGEYDYPPVGDVVDREWIMRLKLGA